MSEDTVKVYINTERQPMKLWFMDSESNALDRAKSLSAIYGYTRECVEEDGEKLIILSK